MQVRDNNFLLYAHRISWILLWYGQVTSLGSQCFEIPEELMSVHTNTISGLEHGHVWLTMRCDFHHLEVLLCLYALTAQLTYAVVDKHTHGF